ARNAKYALRHQGGRSRVEVWGTAVGKEVPVAGIQEQLCSGDGFGNHSCDVHVAKLVLLHDVDLQRNAVLPLTELGDRDGAAEEERSDRADTALRQLLHRYHPEREAGVYQLFRQLPRSLFAALSKPMCFAYATPSSPLSSTLPSNRSGVWTA